ncbi:hypothetical protein EBR25_07430 [bacterium]|nr:hypothetical protein [bacterium]
MQNVTADKTKSEIVNPTSQGSSFEMSRYTLPPVESFFSMRASEEAPSGREVLECLKTRLKVESAVIAQGYGLEDGPLPVRTLSYVVPTLRLLKELPDTTSAEIYIATQGVLRANPDFDRAAVLQNEANLTSLLSHYIELVHPSLQSRVRILTDKHLEVNSPTDNFIVEVTQDLAQVVASDQSLSRFIQKKGGDNALRYVAEHAVYMRDAIQPRPFEHLLVDEMQRDVDNVIMIGGPAEKIFYRARKLLVEAKGLNHAAQTAQLITPVGEKRPPYHFEDGEVAISDFQSRIHSTSPEKLLQEISTAVTNEYGRNHSVVRDLMVLFADAGNFSVLPDKGMVRACLSGALEAPYREALERGVSKLKNVVEKLSI